MPASPPPVGPRLNGSTAAASSPCPTVANPQQGDATYSSEPPTIAHQAGTGTSEHDTSIPAPAPTPVFNTHSQNEGPKAPDSAAVMTAVEAAAAAAEAAEAAVLSPGCPTGPYFS